MRDVVLFFGVLAVTAVLIADKAAFDGAILRLGAKARPTAMSIAAVEQ
jgi:hypothetical protein